MLGEWDVADLGVESSVVDQSIHSTVTSSRSREAVSWPAQLGHQPWNEVSDVVELCR